MRSPRWLRRLARRPPLPPALLLTLTLPLACGAPAASFAQPSLELPVDRPPTPLRWSDLAPATQARLSADGLSDATFAALLDRTRTDTDRRMTEGSFDHLVYYALQSTYISPAPAIEPALSARTFVETLGRARVPEDAAARLDALAKALSREAPRYSSPSRDVWAPRPGSSEPDAPRLALCRQIIMNVGLAGASQGTLRARLEKEYARAMAFLYDKEFVAARATNSREATATLYHTRAHSTDTQMEAGFAVSEALATLKALAPATRISRVLIVGPGLDVAPRTGLLEEIPPRSYQPFAVADALIASKLSDRDTLKIDIVDINPLVVQHIEHMPRLIPPSPLTYLPSVVILPGWRDDARTRLSEEFRRYVQDWGKAIRITFKEDAVATSGRDTDGRTSADAGRHMTDGGAQVSPALARLGARRVFIDIGLTTRTHARRANIVTDRLTVDDARYDLVVITNVLPYLNDTELSIALSNVAQALAPGGAFIHNEPRKALLATSAVIGLPAVQSRTVQIAIPAGGPPIFDTILLHRKN